MVKRLLIGLSAFCMLAELSGCIVAPAPQPAPGYYVAPAPATYYYAPGYYSHGYNHAWRHY